MTTKINQYETAHINTSGQSDIKKALDSGIITEHDIKNFDSLSNNPAPEAQKRYFEECNNKIKDAEKLHSDFMQTLEKSPFEPQTHKGFIEGFMQTRNIEEKRTEIKKLREYIDAEQKFVQQLQNAETEVKTIYEKYCKKYYQTIDRNKIKEAAQKICRTKARINSGLKQRILTPKDAESLLNEWEKYPPDQIGTFIKIVEKKIFEAEKSIKNYQKELTIFSKLIRMTIPDSSASKPIENDFWMFFLQGSETQQEREQKLADLRKFIKTEQKTLATVKSLSPIEKTEYTKRYKDQQTKLSKEKILEAIKKESGEIASEYFKFFKENPNIFSKKAQTHLCMEFATLGSFKAQKKHIQDNRKEFLKIKEITLKFFKLPESVQKKNKKHMIGLTTSKDRKRFYELITSDKPDSQKKEIFKDKVLSIKEKEQILNNYETATDKERKIIYQSYKLLKLQTIQAIEKFSELPQNILSKTIKQSFKASTIQEKLQLIEELSNKQTGLSEKNEATNMPNDSKGYLSKLEAVTTAVINENRETTQALTLLTIAYHTAKAHELSEKGHGISAEERIAKKSETKKEEQLKSKQLEDANQKNKTQTTVIESDTDSTPTSTKTTTIERVKMDIGEFSKEKQRIEDMYTELKTEEKEGKSTLYKERTDWTLLNNEDKAINAETAKQRKKRNEEIFKREIAKQTHERLAKSGIITLDSNNSNQPKTTGIKTEKPTKKEISENVDKAIETQLEKRGFNDEDSCSKLRKKTA